MSNSQSFSNQPLSVKSWRAITYDYVGMSSESDESRLYCLTDFEVAWLSANLPYYNWKTRWENTNATQTELNDQQSELELKLMTPICVSAYQIQYGYKREIEKQLETFDALYDVGGIPDLNPQTPTDFYSGDGSADRLDALCTACNIYVRSYSQNWVTQAQVALGITVITGLLASISIVGGIIAGVLVGGLALITQTALNAFTDDNAIDNVICCMANALNNSAVTELNFQNSLDSCGFVVGTNEAIIRDIIASDLSQFDNWLSFLDSLGNAYTLAQAGTTACTCSLIPCFDYDFTIDEQGFIGAIFPSETPRAVYQTLTGWGSNPNALRGQVGIQLNYTGSLTELTLNLDIPITGDKQWLLFVDDVIIENVFGVSGSTYVFTIPPSTNVLANIEVFAIDHSVIGAGQPLAPFVMTSIDLCGTGIPDP